MLFEIKRCQEQTDIEIELFLPVGFLKERENLFPCFFYLWLGPDQSDFLILLLDEKEWMVDVLKWRLSGDPEFSHLWLPLE